MQKQHFPTDAARNFRQSSRLYRTATLGAPLLLLAIAGCASSPPASDVQATSGSGARTTGPTGLRRVLGALAPYRITVQQGNFVSSEMLTQLKVGMTTDQVRFALGTPLLIDAFHAPRWDYIFRLQRGSGEVTTSRVTVLFMDDKVVSFEGGNLPTEVEYLARIAGTAAPEPKEYTAGQAKPPSAAK